MLQEKNLANAVSKFKGVMGGIRRKNSRAEFFAILAKMAQFGCAGIGSKYHKSNF